MQSPKLATINAEAEADAADELPNLEKIAGEHRMASQGAIESASETSLSLNFDGSSVAALDDLEELLAALGFSDAIMDPISNTRALDGTLTADVPHADGQLDLSPRRRSDPRHRAHRVAHLNATCPGEGGPAQRPRVLVELLLAGAHLSLNGQSRAMVEGPAAHVKPPEELFGVTEDLTRIAELLEAGDVVGARTALRGRRSSGRIQVLVMNSCTLPSHSHEPRIPAIGKVGKKMKLAVGERDGWHCRYCGLPVADGGYSHKLEALLAEDFPQEAGGPVRDNGWAISPRPPPHGSRPCHPT